MSLRLTRKAEEAKRRKAEDENEDDGCRPGSCPYYLLPITYYLLL